MRIDRERSARGCIALATLAAVIVSCAHGTRGREPKVHEIELSDARIEADVKISGEEVGTRKAALAARGMRLAALWRIPGVPDWRLAIVNGEPEPDAYGPQLVVISATEDSQIVYSSPRLFDDDFVYPTFFQFADRTLLLADHGSEDAYGMIAWSFETRHVRDLGILQVALPPAGDDFTIGASSSAKARLQNAHYIIEIPGPVLLYPRQERERVLAPRGRLATFCEKDSKLAPCEPGA
jgi:hypothetical protein